MSTKYPGGLITKTPVTPAGPYETGAAPGVWTVEQALQYTKQGIWPTQGLTPNYIEDVFSTYLYTGTTSTQTFNNGIDLSTKGGLVWIKKRTDAYSHYLTDSANGVGNYLSSNSAGVQNWAGVSTDSVTSFNTNGFTVGADTTLGWVNNGNVNDKFVSWTWRKQPKFFDVVTFTAGSNPNARISHSLNSVPGMILLKANQSRNWVVYHKSLGINSGAYLNLTNAAFTSANTWGSSAPTTTDFGFNEVDWATPGVTQTAYLFADNAGGFGLTGTDNVISCGGFTKSGSSDVTVNLGFEPQWILMKSSSNAQNWFIFDTMRGMSWSAGADYLNPNTSSAETPSGPTFKISATGFTMQGMIADASYIYIAIRRGPMKVPTDATKVFYPTYGTGGTPGYPSSFTVDGLLNFYLSGTIGNPNLSNRLVGTNYIATSSTAAEVNGSPYWKWDFQTGTGTSVFTSAFVGALLQRAPNFFDVVCYTGTGSATTVAHNLGVSPELIIIKKRSNTSDWAVLQTGVQKQLYLNGNYAGDVVNATYFGNDSVYVAPTSTVFSLGSSSGVNGVSGQTFVAYLFATCAGVSKVGSYTGTGATQTISCGFTGGARFVLIKRTDSTGDWYVWDTARGMVSGTDPSLLLNSTAAEVNANSIYTTTGGFQIVSTAAGINASGGTYIFLSIA